MEKSFDFDVKVTDKPVDIYFLLDLSSSMKETKDKLIAAAEKIVERITRLTQNAKIGKVL